MAKLFIMGTCVKAIFTQRQSIYCSGHVTAGNWIVVTVSGGGLGASVPYHVVLMTRINQVIRVNFKSKLSTHVDNSSLSARLAGTLTTTKYPLARLRLLVASGYKYCTCIRVYNYYVDTLDNSTAQCLGI